MVIGNIWNALDIAKQGLYAQQEGIAVTGNNIANVNTEGYSRQHPVFQTSPVGFGVFVKNAQRYYDNFLTEQLNDLSQLNGKYNEEEKGLSKIEVIFDESQENAGLGNAIDDFFAGWSELANDPTSYAKRADLITHANTLIQVMQRINNYLSDFRKELSGEIENTIKVINDIAKQIAYLNGEIVKAEANQSAVLNKLKDERDLLLKKLSSYIDVNSFIDKQGHLIVSIAGGMPLVEGTLYQQLKPQARSDNEGLVDVIYTNSNAINVNITKRIAGGKLGGYLNLRDNFIINYQERLNRIAATIINEVNKLHKNGIGLNGSTGLNFFDDLLVNTVKNDDNRGGAEVTASSIYDHNLLTMHKYKVVFTSSSTFDIIDITKNSVVSSGNTYTSGSPINFDGISITISDVSGSPSQGDVFYVDTISSAVKYMKVNSVVKNDVENIAAAQSNYPGDNRNALAINNLQYANIIDGNSTIKQYYSSLVSDIGIKSADLKRSVKNSQAVLEHLEARREEVAGVSLDEEASNLIRYQASYQANAKYMTTISKLLDSLINVI